MLVKYRFTQGIAMSYTWKPAHIDDINRIVDISYNNHRDELNELFIVDPVLYAKYITHAVIDQMYEPRTTLISVAVDNSGYILGYTWAHVGNRNYWSSDPLLICDMAQVDLTLPIRLRIKLIKDIFELWEEYATIVNVKLICSNSILENQTAFLELHRRAGYIIKGSYAYKKLSTEQTGLPIP